MNSISSDLLDWGKELLPVGESNPLEPSREQEESSRNQIERTKKVVLPVLEQLSDVSKLVVPIHDIHSRKIKAISEEIKGLQAINSQLIDLSSALNKVISEAKKNKRDVVLPENVKEMVKNLREKAVNISWNLDEKFSAEDLEAHKATLSSISDQNKTEMQTKFSTELQVQITKLQALYDSLKMILNRVAKMCDTIIERTR